MYQGTWEKYQGEGNGQTYTDEAIDAAEQIIASGEYALFNKLGDESYKYLFIQAGDDSKEVILARRYYLNIATHNWTRELWFNFMIPPRTSLIFTWPRMAGLSGNRIYLGIRSTGERVQKQRSPYEHDIHCARERVLR